MLNCHRMNMHLRLALFSMALAVLPFTLANPIPILIPDPTGIDSGSDTDAPVEYVKKRIPEPVGIH